MRLPNLLQRWALSAVLAETRGVATLSVDFTPLGDEDAATMATFWAVIPIRHPMINIVACGGRALRILTWRIRTC